MFAFLKKRNFNRWANRKMRVKYPFKIIWSVHKKSLTLTTNKAHVGVVNRHFERAIFKVIIGLILIMDLKLTNISTSDRWPVSQVLCAQCKRCNQKIWTSIELKFPNWHKAMDYFATRVSQTWILWCKDQFDLNIMWILFVIMFNTKKFQFWKEIDVDRSDRVFQISAQNDCAWGSNSHTRTNLI